MSLVYAYMDPNNMQMHKKFCRVMLMKALPHMILVTHTARVQILLILMREIQQAGPMSLKQALCGKPMQFHKKHLQHLRSLPNSTKAFKTSPVLPWTLKTTLLRTSTCRKVRLASILLSMLSDRHVACVALADLPMLQVISWMWIQFPFLQKSLMMQLGNTFKKVIPVIKPYQQG